MTPEVRAEDVEIFEEDHGDRHCADWRVNYEKTRAAIADAIRQAVAEEREACAAVAEARGAKSLHCPPGCKCADPWHVAAAIRERGNSPPSEKA